MAQPPYKVDVLQIEPGASGTRTISRDSSTGGLKFIDPAYPSGVLLADLVGLQSLSGVAVVGTTFTTIQDAIDNASTTGAPPAILIPSGEYTEDLTISKDVVLVGLGYVKITNATAGPTISISEDDDGVPRFVRFLNLTIECTEDGEECVLIDGSNTFAEGTVTVNTAPLAAGDILSIGGVDLTGVAGARTSGSDNFNASLTTAAALAAEIAAAINDSGNSFAATVTATAALGVVTIRAAAPGSAGNLITLSVTTTPAGGMTVSGATLTGGGGEGSEVGADGISFHGCTLLAIGVGTRQIVTNTVNYVDVFGGTFRGSSSTSSCVFAQTAAFRLTNVEWVGGLEGAYNSSNDQPSVTTSEFKVINCGQVGDILVDFIGQGSTLLANCPVVGNITHNGDRTFTAVACEMGDLLVEDTVVARFVGCTRGTLGGAGTPTVAESSLTLSSALVAAVSDTVTFDRLQPDAAYAVLVDVPTAGVVANVTAKSTASFTVTFSAAVTGTVFYTVLRQM